MRRPVFPTGIATQMRCSSLLALAVLASCGGAGLGDPCAATDDCASTLQCVSNVCRPRCLRAPDCGDGFACGEDGTCREATGQLGDSCVSEVDCVGGLACELSGVSAPGGMQASCVSAGGGHPANATCTVDLDCRNHTCALGRCIDLCRETRDCGVGTSCAQIPRIEANGAMFAGCLQATGSLAWRIPVHSSAETVKLPIPNTAQSVAVTMRVDDPNQQVGVTSITSPDNLTLLDVGHDPYADPVRHRPDLGQSVLVMPSTPDLPLRPGAYTLDVRSLKPPFTPASIGTATPMVTAVIKLDASVILDLHFYFLNFEDHPCASAFGTAGTINAVVANSSTFFQNDFLGKLRQVFAHGGVALGTLSYEDCCVDDGGVKQAHPDLDGLDISNAAALLALGKHAVGVNVFFVRSLAPIGLQAFGPNPGPAGLAGTSQSGVIISLDTLCYRTWNDLARLTAHELSRYMGLYDNVGIDPAQRDPISDSDDSSANLMFYSEFGGAELSQGQHDILSRSPVLR
ncbi:hypothetical protein BH11MYX1_BH11MYX1_28850 [soil metagenome]